MKRFGKILSGLFVIVLLFSVMPIQSFSVTASDVDGSATVYFTLSNDGQLVTGADTGKTVLARVPVTIDYFDLADYGLSEFYRYETAPGGGGYINNTLVEQPTVLHLYIRMLEQYYLNGSKLQNGTAAMTISGTATSMYLSNFWGQGENLMYFVDHEYPIMEGTTGATADYILLEDGMEIDVAMFSGWYFYTSGGFANFDPIVYNNIAEGTEVSFQTFLAPTFGGFTGEPTNPYKGLTTKIFDNNWQEIANLTTAVSSTGSFSYGFNDAGTYYVVGTDPKTGDNADTAPAVATVTVVKAGDPDSEEEVGVPESGDLNGDGNVTMAEVLAVAQYVNGIDIELTEAQILVADMDRDGVLTMVDVICILKKSVGL